ncbi:serine aminopeptidase domain-containing protein [Streptomyces sp. NPDC059850]|uniref:serine aminopeptidase domain-containing protein n=1 Tax=Streptomyces sp. NPDC059850 TaxID=3346970 RepID=UPI00364B29D6
MSEDDLVGPASPGPDHAQPVPHRPLTVHTLPPAPRAAVVLLHGGRADGLAPPPPLNLPALRMSPFRTAISRSLGRSGLVLASVRYRCRGWNGPRADAAHDARGALDALTGPAPGLPVVLVGHSMGGRAALLAGGHPSVLGIVALAPWCPPDEPVTHLHGKTIAVLHDEHDRITRADHSWLFAERARHAGAQIHTIAMPHGGHTMLRDARHWHRLTADLVGAILDGTAHTAPGNGGSRHRSGRSWS